MILTYIANKRPPGNGTNQISNIWGKWFWRRRLLNILYLFLWFKPRTPWGGAILYPTIWIHLVENLTSQCYILNFKIWAKWFWRRRFWIFLLFLWFESRTPWCRAIFDPGAFIWANLVKDHYAMQHNLGPLAWGHLGACGLLFEQTW